MKAIFFSIIAGCFFLVGYLIATNKKDNKNLGSFSIGMAFTVLILLVLFDIIPEVMEHLHNKNILFVVLPIIIGFLLFKMVDLFIPNHKHQRKNHDEKHLNHVGLITTIALIIHNVIEGMSIYEIAAYNSYSGLLMCLGVGLHNLPFGMEITATMDSNEKEGLKSILVLFISTPIGALIASLFNNINGILLGTLMGFTIGIILYLIVFELFYEIRKNKEKKYTSLGMICGIIIILVTMILGG